MANEQFDDRRLINLARFNFFAGESENKKVEKLFEKEKLTNDERNELLAFLEESRYTRPMSLKDMKTEIFRIIGFTTSNWNGTVSRAELEAIYNFIKGLKK